MQNNLGFRLTMARWAVEDFFPTSLETWNKIEAIAPDMEMCDTVMSAVKALGQVMLLSDVDEDGEDWVIEATPDEFVDAYLVSKWEMLSEREASA
jgi:hypothetical protein